MDDEQNWTGGYGTPPFDKRFRKGQSGNPNGRRRKDRPMAIGDRGLEALHEQMPVVRGGKKTWVPAIDAMIINHRNLVFKSADPLDYHRFFQHLERLGYDMGVAQAIGRGEDRKRYEGEIASLNDSIKACHAEIADQARLIRALTRERTRGNGAADGGAEI